MSELLLKTSFESEVRPLIDLIDRLREFGLDSDINLPAVAVIGDQSAGKSSVLEAISGVQLPRGTGIVTRCPLMMRMKRLQPGQPWEGQITFKPLDEQKRSIIIPEQKEVGKFVRKVVSPFDPDVTLYTHLTSHLGSVLQAQFDMTGNQKGISEELIHLEVASPDVPDLTLIDLPGIARNAVEGQPDNIEDLTKGLIKTYIERQTTIILAVLQCTVDLATCEAIKMAKTYDTKGTRTLGVLTMPDRVEQGAEDQVMSIMANESYPLSKGYIMVKCRGQTALKAKQSLTVALKDEKRFFETHEHFRTLHVSQRGIDSLSTRLTKELKSHIQDLIPSIRADVVYKLSFAEAKLHHFGICPTTDSEKRGIANELVMRLSTSLKRMAKSEKVDDVLFPDRINSVFSETRKAYKEFHRQATANMPEKDKSTLEAELKREIAVGRGRELPDYSAKFEYVEKYAQRYIQKLQTPAIRCFDEVHNRMASAYVVLVKFYFEPYSLFAEKALEQMRVKAEQIHEDGKREIVRYFAMESNFVFTQDDTYGKILDTSMSSVPKIMKSLVTYYEVAMTRISDHIPMIIHQRLFRDEVDVIIENLKAMVADNDVLQFICEDDHIAQQRAIYTGKYERLSYAVQELKKCEPVPY